MNHFKRLFTILGWVYALFSVALLVLLEMIWSTPGLELAQFSFGFGGAAFAALAVRYWHWAQQL